MLVARNIERLHCTQLSRSRDLSFMERERKRQSYIHSKAHERDSDSELEHAAAKRKGSRGKLAVSAHASSFACVRIEISSKTDLHVSISLYSIDVLSFSNKLMVVGKVMFAVLIL